MPSNKRSRNTRVAVSPIAELKGALTRPGDVRSDIEFQNDVNALLATVSRMTTFGPAGDPANAVQDGGPLVADDLVADATPTPVPRRLARRAGDPR